MVAFFDWTETPSTSQAGHIIGQNKKYDREDPAKDVSRGFRDADDTQQLSGREADEAIRRIQSLGERQARRAAELRHEGTYGVCESCGKPIGDDRLAAVPEATRCIACQVDWEAGRADS